MTHLPQTDPVAQQQSTAGFQVGLYRHTHPNNAAPGKYFQMTETGVKKGTHGAMSQADYCTTRFASLTQLKDWLPSVNHKWSMTAGVSRCEAGVCVGYEVAEGTRTDTGAPLISRNNAHLSHPSGPALLVIDMDDLWTMQTLGDVDAQLTAALPQLGACERLLTSSSGSNVSMMGLPVVLLKGAHCYILVADGKDIPRALDVMFRRAILNGYGQHKISKSGGFLRRTVVDRAMRVPSQPIYLHAAMNGDLTQTKAFHHVAESPTLDTRETFPDLTAEEEVAFEAMCKAAEAKMKPQMETAQAQHKTDTTAALMSKNPDLSEADATRQVEQMRGGVLGLDVVLRTSKGTTTVRDIMSNPASWDCVTCRDPIEPDYGSDTTAKIYTEGHQPHLKSFAHSGGDKPTIYRMMPILSPAEPVVAPAEPVGVVRPDPGVLWSMTPLPLAERVRVDPRDLLTNLQMLIDGLFICNGQPTIRTWQEQTYIWVTTHWEPVAESWLMDLMFNWMSKCLCVAVKKDGVWVHDILPPSIATRKNYVAALRSLTSQPMQTPLGWSDQRPGQWMSVQNGLLDFNTGLLVAHTPAFFNMTHVAANWERDKPMEGTDAEQFFTSVFDGQLNLIQEITGYLLSGATHFQKAFMITGQSRSGKGTYAGVLKHLLGTKTTSLSASKLGGDFGTEPMIGKSVVFLPDVRIGKTANHDMIAETILTLTGEDNVTVPRKNKLDWEGKIEARLVVISNSVPSFRDRDGVVAARFKYVHLGVSHAGSEDLGLANKLAVDADVILFWAWQGWQRLTKAGRFSDNETDSRIARRAKVRMDPVGMFFADCVKFTSNPDDFISAEELFALFETYAQDNADVAGYSLVGFSKSVNGRDFPIQHTRRLNHYNNRTRGWAGLTVSGFGA